MSLLHLSIYMTFPKGKPPYRLLFKFFTCNQFKVTWYNEFNNLRRDFLTSGSERWFFEILVSFFDTSIAFQHLLNILILSSFDWLFKRAFILNLSRRISERNSSLINSPLSHLFDSKDFFKKSQRIGIS